jgi:hypothetical protein
LAEPKTDAIFKSSASSTFLGWMTRDMCTSLSVAIFLNFSIASS